MSHAIGSFGLDSIGIATIEVKQLLETEPANERMAASRRTADEQMTRVGLQSSVDMVRTLGRRTT